GHADYALVSDEAWKYRKEMSVLKDFRYAARKLKRLPVQSTALILTLVLVIAANGTVFSIVNAVLIQPLRYRDADRIVAVFTDTSGNNTGRTPVTPLDYEDWVKDTKTFESLTALRYASLNLADGSTPERITGVRTTPNLFSTLKVDPLLGRDFSNAG